MIDQHYSYVLKDGEIKDSATGAHYGLYCKGVPPTEHLIVIPAGLPRVYGVFLVGDDERCRAYVDVFRQLVIEMPCGNQIKVGEIKVFENVPCPCGDPDHWLLYRVLSVP